MDSPVPAWLLRRNREMTGRHRPRRGGQSARAAVVAGACLMIRDRRRADPRVRGLTAISRGLWGNGNPAPASIRDRPTSAQEVVNQRDASAGLRDERAITQ